MNTFVVVVAVVAALGGLLMLAALLTRKEFSIEREVLIRRPRHEVFDYVRFVRNHENFSKWLMADPGRQRKLSGRDGLPGFTYRWESGGGLAGRGEQRLLHVRDGESIHWELRLSGPFPAPVLLSLCTARVSESETLVRWSLDGGRSFTQRLAEVLMNLKGALAGDLEASLAALKNMLEYPEEGMLAGGPPPAGPESPEGLASCPASLNRSSSACSPLPAHG